MGRLIDADDLIGVIQYNTNYNPNKSAIMADELIRYINSQPTAFDVDKVVEHLTKRFDFCQEMAEKNDKAKLEKMAFAWREKASGVMDAIYIVKGAVKDE